MEVHYRSCFDNLRRQPSRDQWLCQVCWSFLGNDASPRFSFLHIDFRHLEWWRFALHFVFVNILVETSTTLTLHASNFLLLRYLSRIRVISAQIVVESSFTGGITFSFFLFKRSSSEIVDVVLSSRLSALSYCVLRFTRAAGEQAVSVKCLLCILVGSGLKFTAQGGDIPLSLCW